MRVATGSNFTDGDYLLAIFSNSNFLLINKAVKMKSEEELA